MFHSLLCKGKSRDSVHKSQFPPPPPPPAVGVEAVSVTSTYLPPALWRGGLAAASSGPVHLVMRHSYIYIYIFQFTHLLGQVALLLLVLVLVLLLRSYGHALDPESGSC